MGKTSLATIIATELNANIIVVQGPNLIKPSDILAIFSKLKPFDIIFIDEIQSISKEIEEILYPVLEDNFINLIIGKEYSAQSINIKIPPFTLIAATTKLFKISNPLQNRFTNIFYWEDYTLKQLTNLVILNAQKMNLNIEFDKAYLIAQNCRFTPRIANNLLKQISYYALVKKENVISLKTIRETLLNLQIYDFGLNNLDIKYLKTLNNYYNQPLGILTLAAILNEDVKTLEDKCEPLLLKINFIQKTPRGRVVTNIAKKFLQKI